VTRIYLDNCCYNRPYDDQSQMRINLESQAKLFIQEKIREKKIELVTSYVLDFENGRNRYKIQSAAIQRFMDENSRIYVGKRRLADIEEKAGEIQRTGVKEKDALHVACAIMADCQYFLSTDDRLLKYKTEEIELITPTEFVRIWEG